MARHAAPPKPRRSIAGRALVYGLAPAIVLGGVLAPAAVAAEETGDTSGTTAGELPEPVSPEPVEASEPSSSSADTTTADDAEPQLTEYPVADLVQDGAGEEPAASPSADAEAGPAAGDAAAQEPIVVTQADGFQTVGATWPAEVEESVPELQVRVRDDEGAWSEWKPIEESTETSDPGEGGEVRGGTEPMYVGEADAVELAPVEEGESIPAEVTLALVSSPEITAKAAQVAGPVEEEALPAQVMAAAAAGWEGPAVVRRSQWGATAPQCSWDSAGALVGGVVHHTVNPNSYTTVAEAMQLIRNDQAYHQQSRGWCDIGYNFLVDKWGNIYEGAAGSMDSALIGAHASGFNTGTVGVALVGDHVSVTPSTAALNGVAKIIGHRLDQYDLDPGGSMTYVSNGGTSKYPAGTAVGLPRVFAHRDTSNTACPGDAGYAQVGSIRASARAYAQAENVVRALYQDLLGRAPEAGGLESWSTYMMSGGSQTALVSAVTESEEYVRLRVHQAYREVLLREPDSGAEGWVAAVRQGRLGVDDVQLIFYQTEEFYQQSGGTDRAFVAHMYDVMLGRAPSAEDLDFWTARVQTVGRANVVRNIWFSMEAAMQRTGAYYRTFLQRDPDWDGQVGWSRVMLLQGEGAVRTGIAGSPEYRILAQNRF